MNENKPVTAEEFLNSKGITRLTCYTDGNASFYFKELANEFEEYATLKTQQLTAENERLRKNMLDAEWLGMVIHNELSKLDIPMDDYTPLSKLLIDLKTLLRVSEAGINLTQD